MGADRHVTRRDFIVGLVGAVLAGELVEHLAAADSIATSGAKWGDEPVSVDEMARIFREVYMDAFSAFPVDYESPFLTRMKPRSLLAPAGEAHYWTVRVR